MKHALGGHSAQGGTLGMRERFKDGRHDTYQPRQKWPEYTACRQCGAVFVEGRWTWETHPASAGETICPACRRIAERYPAGTVELSGDFFEEHRQEILNLVHNVEAEEMREHPLERLMDITQQPEGTTVFTTGIHVARRIGDAVHNAYKGELDTKYSEAEDHIRVTWKR